MIVEILSILAIFVAGCAIVRTAGIRDWGLPALGFLAGVAWYLAVGLVQVAAPMPTTPVITLAVTVLVPVGWWVARWRRGHDVSVPLLPAIGTVALLLGAVVTLRSFNRVNWHADTFEYLMGGSMLANGSFDDAVTPIVLTKRLLSVGLLHSPAHLGGEFYLRSITPLIAAATAAALVWFLYVGLRGRVDRTRLVAFSVLAVLLLFSINRFNYHGFYLNGHLLTAMLMLLIVGCGWLLVTDDRVPATGLMALQLLALPAIVITRAEAGMLAVLALLPMLLSSKVSLRYRSTVLAVLGGSIVLWEAYVAVIMLDRGVPVPFSVTGLLLQGVILLLAIPVLRRWRPEPRSSTLLWLAEGGLWLALIGLTAVKPEVMIRSVLATEQNVVNGNGRWGYSLVMLGALILAALVLLRFPQQKMLRFAVTTFLPLMFLLAYLREGAYRVGNGDSLNRMLIQIVPVAVLYLIVAMVSGEWRFGKRASQTESERSTSGQGTSAQTETVAVGADDKAFSAS